jgi:hypothetical protein
MLIVRKRVRLGAWLAIFALATQLVASFAHVHKEDLLAGASGRPDDLQRAVLSSGGTAFPAQPAGDDDHDAVCSICASIALAGAAFLPEPPAITLVLAYQAVQLPEDAAVTAPDEHRAGFRARGPPA